MDDQDLDAAIIEAMARAEVARSLATNALHELCLVASVFADWFAEFRSEAPEDIASEHGWGTPQPHMAGFEIPAETIEQGGILGLYRYLGERKLRYRFGNDLSRIIHGIDAIALDESRLLLCESKGTTRPHRSARSYLRKTKTKGRQLDSTWCWRSFWPLSQNTHSARVFLEHVRSVAMGRYERVLCVTQVRKKDRGYELGESRVWDERELSKSIGTPEGHPHVLRMLEEIDREDPEIGRRLG